MTTYRISLGDFVEVNMAVENDRPLAPWTVARVYEVFNRLQPGDLIEVTPEVSQKDHYGAYAIPEDSEEVPQ